MKNVKVDGYNNNGIIIYDSTNVVLDGVISNNNTDTNNGFFVDNLTDTTIKNLKFNGNSENGMLMWSISNITINNVNINDNSQRGIKVSNSNGMTIDNTIVNNNGQSFGYSGLYDDNSGGLTIKNSEFTNNGGYGFIWSGVNEISDTKLTVNGDDGASARRDGMTISNVNSSSNNANGLKVRYSSDVTVTDLESDNNGGKGLVVESYESCCKVDGFVLECSSTSITDNGANGVSFQEDNSANSDTTVNLNNGDLTGNTNDDINCNSNWDGTVNVDASVSFNENNCP